MGFGMNRSAAVLGVAACALATARPTVLVQPVSELENTVFLTNTSEVTSLTDTRFESPGRWISRPPAAVQSPIPVQPVHPETKGGPGGPSFGIGEPGWPVARPVGSGPGGGDPGGPVPVPMPSGFGLGVSGLLAVAAASRRRRA